MISPGKTSLEFLPFQIVDMSAIHGPNCIPVSLKVRREIISAMQEALNPGVAYPPKRGLIAQLAMKLQHIWGKSCLQMYFAVLAAFCIRLAS